MYIRKQYAQILCVLIASLAINGRVICAQRVVSEAIAGEPFGVARVTLPLQANDAANSPAAAEHQAALLQWFRGLKAELTMPPGRLELHT